MSYALRACISSMTWRVLNLVENLTRSMYQVNIPSEYPLHFFFFKISAWWKGFYFGAMETKGPRMLLAGVRDVAEHSSSPSTGSSSLYQGTEGSRTQGQMRGRWRERDLQCPLQGTALPLPCCRAPSLPGTAGCEPPVETAQGSDARHGRIDMYLVLHLTGKEKLPVLHWTTICKAKTTLAR